MAESEGMPSEPRDEDKSNQGQSGKDKSSRKRKQGRRSKDAPVWQRDRNAENKRRKLERPDYKPAIYATDFTQDEIAAEARRPKRKAAVMIGYSGTGYHGMQLSHDQKTIEGELFQAMVKAGAISKANADDPKKVSFARCARTDKGVHAAGNVVSLKLIIEDADVVEKINEHLSDQIRVWGIERTSNSFSAYNLCDSRIYEYLIPTHCFLPPHPKSYMGQRLHDLAVECDDLEGLQSRQAETADFWADAERNYIQPVLDALEPEVREAAYQNVFQGGEAAERAAKDIDQDNTAEPENPQETGNKGSFEGIDQNESETTTNTDDKQETATNDVATKEPKQLTPLELGTRKLKSAVLAAKKSWRINPERLARVREALSQYVGIHNYHNYTIRKQFNDPSAKRFIKSFVVYEEPMLKDGSEWISLKVHGQSFMMHQIRKMVGMAALVVRSGRDLNFMRESMTHARMSIPRAPGLGLLLERPIFDAYNSKLKKQPGGDDKNSIEFDTFREAMDDFKQREIYSRIFREEEAGNVFHQLFWACDHLRSTQYLYLSSKGLAAVEKSKHEDRAAVDSDEDDALGTAGGEDG